MGVDHRHLDAHAFAIINPLQVDRSQWQDLPVAFLMPSALAEQTNQSMPLLLDLRRLSDAKRGALLERADGWDRNHDTPFFSALLQTTATHERLALHLTRHLLLDAPGNDKVLLRWFDPAVFQHLRWLLDEPQTQTLYGPIAAWTWRDSRQQWRTHPVPSGTAAESRLRLRAAQWSVMGRLGVLNRTMKQVHRNTTELVIDDAGAQRIDSYLQQAYDVHGFTEEADARLFAEQGTRYGTDVHHHPEVIRRMAQVQAQETTYVDACLDLDKSALRKWTFERSTNERMQNA